MYWSIGNAIVCALRARSCVVGSAGLGFVPFLWVWNDDPAFDFEGSGRMTQRSILMGLE